MYFKNMHERKNYLEGVISKLENTEKIYPSGNLRISMSGATPQYYHITGSSAKLGKYIDVGNTDLAKALATRGYEEKVLAAAKREYADIVRFLEKEKMTRVEDIYGKLNERRKLLIEEPIVLSDADYAKKWEYDDWVPNTYREEEKVYPTVKGDFVRSKSEAMIANAYYELGIPYRYEDIVKLPGNKRKYCDFSLLKIQERKVIYHEHLGMIDDADYRKNSLIKINEYASAGILLGDNLIITYETSYCPLNIDDFKRNMSMIFKRS